MFWPLFLPTDISMRQRLSRFPLRFPIEIVMTLLFMLYIYLHGPEEQYEPFFQTNGSTMALCLLCTMTTRVITTRLWNTRCGLIASLISGIITTGLFLTFHPRFNNLTFLLAFLIASIACLCPFPVNREKEESRSTGLHLLESVFEVMILLFATLCTIFLVHFIISTIEEISQESSVGPNFTLEAIEEVIAAFCLIVWSELFHIFKSKKGQQSPKQGR